MTSAREQLELLFSPEPGFEVVQPRRSQLKIATISNAVH